MEVGLAQQNLAVSSSSPLREASATQDCKRKWREREERRGGFAMDIITQLQEQLNEIAMVAVNTFGTLQRDAPPDRLSNSYPDPLNPNPKPEEDTKPQGPPQPGAPAPAQPQPQAQPPAPPQPPALDLAEHPKAMSHALVLAAKKFDALVAALPLSSEEDQLKRIQELQAENEVVGLELQKQLEAAGNMLLAVLSSRVSANLFALYG
ncbi:hypothetical protein HU200_028587 [Digitaria exilis]|uniref:Mediator of RNA polymerase II transcription subunit 21 n=1 Tax=Digitaria exilis TaxID=1010633 RepID=A0A835BS53_9POAL|nr:hypothetical protein HU200_028587 [Digitaria exilis]